ncbi:MAG: hypothetical protein K8S98_11065 [Planctomycetes bacterium]|nr:hypothetical protein [Planctomycetota bacterium]
MSTAGRTSTPKHDIVLIVLFVASLVAPVIDMCVRPMEARTPTVELRTPAPVPTLEPTLESVATLPVRVESWWKDFFGLRDLLIGMRSYTYWYGLRSSPTPEVLRGKHGWVFFDGNENIACDRGASPLSTQEVDAWVKLLGARRAWLEARGIKQLYAFVPSKLLVYPEEAPEWVKILGPSRLEQVLAKLDPSWNADVVYVKEGQLAEKQADTPDDPAWFPLGTHFCDRGAFRAYGEIMAKLHEHFPSLSPEPKSNFKSMPAPRQGDTWAKRFYLDHVMLQSIKVLVPTAPRHAVALGGLPDNPRSDQDRLDGARGDEPRILVFHDSNAERLRPFLSEHFREVLWIWRSDFDIDLVESWKPDLVLFLFGDRFFLLTSPTLDPRIQDVKSDFDAASEILLSFDPVKNQPPLVPQEGALVEPRDGATWIWTPGASDTVLLPRFEPPPGKTPYLHLSIDSPWETDLHLMFQTHAEPSWARRRAMPVGLHPGLNEVYLALSTPDLNGALLLRPGRRGGKYRVLALELRAAGE